MDEHTLKSVGAFIGLVILVLLAAALLVALVVSAQELQRDYLPLVFHNQGLPTLAPTMPPYPTLIPPVTYMPPVTPGVGQ